MRPSKLQSWWFHRQGLDGSWLGELPASVLERSGWARSVGGVGPYLTLFARGGTSREAADAAVARMEIHELPAARGCTYVVPAQDFALALRVGQSFAEAPLRVAARLGVGEEEIDRLCHAVLAALAGGPLHPEGIRGEVGGAARNLGEAGKKKGVTTTLPLALGRLQALGEIRRIPANGRLDQQRYLYERWTPSPLAGLAPSRPLGEDYTDLVRRFFRWVGPARPAEFQWFSGLGVNAAREALAPLGLVPADADGDRLLLPEDEEAFHAFQPPAEPAYALVSSLDAITATRRDLVSLLSAADRAREVVAEDARRPLGGLTDLPNHAILDRGQLIGLWDYDPDSAAIVWFTFAGTQDPGLEAAIRRTEDFIRDDLGDARTFSLDSPRSRTPRIAALRSAASAAGAAAGVAGG